MFTRMLWCSVSHKRRPYATLTTPVPRDTYIYMYVYIYTYVVYVYIVPVSGGQNPPNLEDVCLWVGPRKPDAHLQHGSSRRYWELISPDSICGYMCEMMRPIHSIGCSGVTICGIAGRYVSEWWHMYSTTCERRMIREKSHRITATRGHRSRSSG